ncbi:MAG: 50S ribosomal protein L4 [Actinomycetota bacterium]
MTEIDVRSASGDVVGRVALDDAVFGTQVNVPVMHQVVRAQLAAARSGTHATKKRGDVRGGGKKPWRQKGTGRARQGSIRAPQWTGGGAVFGPQPRDHDMKVPKKMRALALRSALSDRAREGRIAVVDRFTFEGPKTKDAIKALESLGVSGKALVVLDSVDMVAGKSFRNLPSVHVIIADQINTHDIIAADWIVFTQAAVERVNERGKPEKKSGKKPALSAESGETE